MVMIMQQPIELKHIVRILCNHNNGLYSFSTSVMCQSSDYLLVIFECDKLLTTVNDHYLSPKISVDTILTHHHSIF